MPQFSFSLQKKHKGVISALAAVSLIGLIVAAGLAIDTSKAYSDYRHAQTAADAAALAGAFEKFYGRDSTIIDAAQTESSNNGFSDGSDNITVTVNNPPVSGFYSGDNHSVEVIITQPSATSFLQIIGIDTIDYTVRSVANSNTASGANCVYVLSPDQEKVLEVSSSSSLDAKCGIAVNSDHNKAMKVESGACLKGHSISVVGGYTGGSCDSGGSAYQCGTSGSCPTSGKGKSSSQSPLVVPDPLLALQAPSVNRSSGVCPPDESCNGSGCSGKEKDSGGPYEAYTVDSSGSTTLNPGTYCGGIFIKKGNVTLNPGVYILRGGGLRVEGGNANLTGSSVSFYNTCYWACNDSNSDHDPEKGKEWYWPLEVNSSSTVTLSAPLCNGGASGSECVNPLDGVLFFSDRDAPSSSNPGDYPVNRIDSSATASLSGAMYMWNQHLKFHSNASGNDVNSILVSKFLEVSSGSSVNINLTTGNGGSLIKRVTLVE
ncbi:MAG: hypothetical protein JKY55_09380 [Aliivibrio sp.]|uniref:pilus assembly protein TadG-related protein n=1 Tax=Aliivibrio sp. TaxID=1872443 RepID=UPI001A369CC3|nr:hypothetical protein [Aliivibrio sp.]